MSSQPSNSNKPCIVLASGGTGGHLFPAEALALEMLGRGWRVVLMTDKRTLRYGDAMQATRNAGLELEIIRAGHMGKGLKGRIFGVMEIIIGFFQARRKLKRLKPSVVVGFGGYPSFPTMWAAFSRGVKTIIHEQNALLGRANRVLAPKVDAIATSFKETASIRRADASKCLHTGNPVRAAICAIREIPYPDLTSDSTLHILVTGGSQGATVFSTILPAALASLPRALRQRVRIDQQCRKEDIEVVRAGYLEIGVSADLATFFSDVPSRLASSHLMIARAGASTVAEVTASGRPAILVPYPHSTDGHQDANAHALEQVGGGWVIPQEAFTAQTLMARLESFLTMPGSLLHASEKSRQAGRPEAAARLADLAEEIAGKSSTHTSSFRKMAA